MLTLAEAHAFLPPSGAHIWGPGGCAFYPTMNASQPQEESEAAREGTAAHHLLALRLEGKPWAVGDVTPNGEIVNQEMVDCTDEAVRFIEGIRGRLQELGWTETSVSIPAIHPQCWGTPDWFLVDEIGYNVYIVDYKHGHRFVSPWESYQLVPYALGALTKVGATLGPDWSFHLTIIQPRSYHADGIVKTWTARGDRIMKMAEALRQAALAATGPNPAMSTGDHCNDCDGRWQCPAFLQVAGAALDTSMVSLPVALTPEAIGTMRTMVATALKRLEGMATGLDAQVERMARDGKTVPGWELGTTNSRTVWKVGLDEVYALGDMLGVELRKPAALTPKQAIDAGLDGSVISAYSETPPGKIKVKPSDARAARRAFD